MSLAPRKYTATVRDIGQVTPRTRFFRLRLEDDRTFSSLPGQWIHVVLKQEGNLIPRLRAYTVVGIEEEGRVVVIVAQRHDMAPGIPHLFDLRAGDTVVFWGPFGTFFLPEDGARHLLMLGFGIGVIPFLAHLGAMLTVKDPRKVLLFWELQTEDEVFLEDQLRAWERALSFHAKISIRQPGSTWTGSTGSILAVAEKRLQHFQGLEVLVAGGRAEVLETHEWLLQKGVERERINMEVMWE